MEGASADSTFGTQTLVAMRRFLDEAELSMPYSSTASLVTKEDLNERSAEDKGEASLGTQTLVAMRRFLDEAELSMPTAAPQAW